jgi:hypothetical protein
MNHPTFRRTIRLALGVVLLTASLAAAYPSLANTPAEPANEAGKPLIGEGQSTFRVFAHPEGLVGHTTANGHVIQPNDFFVALPCFCVLSSLGGNEFEVLIEYNGVSLVLPVWDVGPWNVEDNYWDPPELRTWSGLPQGMPQAQAAYEQGYNGGLDGWDREVLSPAGMDIADGAFAALGMTSSDWVNVTFLWLDDTPRVELGPPPAPFEDIQTIWPDERPPLDPAPVIDDGRYGYIWETGHNVPLPLLEFWFANGGWQIFGLPISEFFREANGDGTTRLVQYFERSILSLSWSDETGAPVVTIDNLGYDTYIDPAAAEPVPWTSTTDTLLYVPETSHTISGPIKQYWETYGGMAVFGLPLSEAWTTSRDGQTVVLQVFERARIEWWPGQAGTGLEFTLGLLTVEILERHGWLSPPPVG